MKSMLLFLCLCILLALPVNAPADYAGAAVIDAQDADRIHLRAAPSASADSLGLYFTGTRVFCLSSPFEPWTQVQIGSATGYMMTQYLVHESADRLVASQQPVMRVHGLHVILQAEPDPHAAALLPLADGDTVTLLGETVDGWCYVRMDNWLHGYVPSSCIQPCTPPEAGELSFADLPAQWLWASGAGAWCSELFLSSDGSFSVSYHDTEMGSFDEAYPHGTVYECYATGFFSPPVQVSPLVYAITVERYTVHGTIGEQIIRDGMLHVTADHTGLALHDTLYLHMPGARESYLSEECRMWTNAALNGTLQTHVLTNPRLQIAFDALLP